MKNLANIEDVKKELATAGIEICLTRSIGNNCFNLVYESYGLFTVNAKAGTCYNKTRQFCQSFNNIIICIDN